MSNEYKKYSSSFNIMAMIKNKKSHHRHYWWLQWNSRGLPLWWTWVHIPMRKEFFSVCILKKNDLGLFFSSTSQTALIPMFASARIFPNYL